jgi:nucleoside-diphosphate-sugar epimerase
MSQQEVKNILIIGATGRIGYKITNALLDKGAFTVSAIIRKETIAVRYSELL